MRPTGHGRLQHGGELGADALGKEGPLVGGRGRDKIADEARIVNVVGGVVGRVEQEQLGGDAEALDDRDEV